MQQLSEEEIEQILAKLEEIDEKIDEIRRDLDVMLEIHEMLHPEALERARETVEGQQDAQ